MAAEYRAQDVCISYISSQFLRETCRGVVTLDIRKMINLPERFSDPEKEIHITMELGDQVFRTTNFRKETASFAIRTANLPPVRISLYERSFLVSPDDVLATADVPLRNVRDQHTENLTAVFWGPVLSGVEMTLGANVTIFPRRPAMERRASRMQR